MIVRALLAAAAVAAVPSVAPPEARAEPVPQKARQLAERGRELHDRGDYARAIAAFQEAYVLAPSAALLFNLAQAYRLQGNCDDAVIMYRRYLAARPGAPARAIAENHLDTVERCQRKRGLNLPMDASMAHLQVAPPPGPEQIRREPAPPRRPGKLKQDLGVGFASGGAIALAATLYFGLEAIEAAREVDAAYDRGAAWREIEPIQARGARAEQRALWFGIGGGVAVATGVTLYVLGKRDERAAPPIVVAPRAGGAEVRVGWQF
ncbi:MAG: tetratricopeptide repeat protein [Kofleriaceae bacterium]